MDSRRWWRVEMTKYGHRARLGLRARRFQMAALNNRARFRPSTGELSSEQAS
jgi:hypothetical protein